LARNYYQVRSLRARTLLGRFDNDPGSGVHLMRGITASEILMEAGLSPVAVGAASAGCMTHAEGKAAAQFPTTPWKLKVFEYDRLYRHGWECTNCKLSFYHRAAFRGISIR
jgi:hypothetical protein